MTSIPATILASPGELPIIRRALDGVLSHALAKASPGEEFEISRTEADDLDGLVSAAPGSVRILSLLPFALDTSRPFEAIEAMLSDALESLAETGDPVFILTAFRSVPERGTREGAALLRRIRKLNLAATDWSREFGAFIVDIDRAFADIGGVVLETDYRLGGEKAAQLAGEELALNIAANGCDMFVAFDVQEHARQHIANTRTNLRATSTLSPAEIIALGKGRARQKVMMNTDAVQENHVSWLVRQVLKGRIGRKEAMSRLVGAMRRRGPRESIALLGSALKQVMAKKRQA